jgi:D-3-phosphoglycerate dehydrogenase / 2-oxoglutarate reductase
MTLLRQLPRRQKARTKCVCSSRKRCLPGIRRFACSAGPIRQKHMYKFWIDEPLLDSALPLLAGVAEMSGPAAAPEVLAQCDASLVPGIRWDAARMDLAPRLKVLSRLGAGYENIDLAAATERGIVVCFAPEAPTVSTAEHAIALLFAVTKDIRNADMRVRNDAWHKTFWTRKGLELRASTLGLVGMGRIGAIVATAMRAVGMRVLAYDPFVPATRAAEMGVTLMPSLHALLAESDVVSLHVPVLPETRGLINSERLAQMKRGAYLVNSARGALIDEDALVEALRSGHLAGAGLDVFQREPIANDHPLLTLDTVVLSDHIASLTWAGHHRLYEFGVRHALQVLRGELPATTLNPEVWGKRRR